VIVSASFQISVPEESRDPEESIFVGGSTQQIEGNRRRRSYDQSAKRRQCHGPPIPAAMGELALGNRSGEYKDALFSGNTAQNPNRPYVHEDTGLAESGIKCLLLESGLPAIYWNHAWLYHAFLHNRVYLRGMGMSPYQRRFERAIAHRRPHRAAFWRAARATRD
jgi:hypothetical protein